MKKHWMPEICYYDESQVDENDLASKLPFIPVPKNETMPKTLFIFEQRETEEFEPGQDGEEIPIIDMELHQFANMSVLKSELSAATYTEVRKALGLPA